MGKSWATFNLIKKLKTRYGFSFWSSIEKQSEFLEPKHSYGEIALVRILIVDICSFAIRKSFFPCHLEDLKNLFVSAIF